MSHSADISLHSTESASPSSSASSSSSVSLSPSRHSSESKPKLPLTPSQLASPVSSFEAKFKSKSIHNPKPQLGRSQSCPASQQALLCFRAHREGRRLGEWAKYTLSLEQYNELLELLADDPELEVYVKDKVRYDYIPDASELVIRMPSKLHDLFTKKVVQEIHNQINTAIAEFSKSSSTSSLAQFLQDVEETTTSDVQASDNPRHRRSPDASFCCNGAQFPGLVIETAYSQGSKSLRRVADDWVMLSDGNVKMVIGLEIGYRAKKNAKVIDKVYVWEPKWKMENVPVLTSECTVNKLFRGLDAQRQVIVNEALTIPLCALAPLVMLENYGIFKTQHSIPVVSIPMTALAAFLDHAQDTFDLVRALQGYKDVPPPQTIKRRWSSSSEEDLREQAARREVRREAMIDLKSERKDKDWNPQS